MNRLESKVAEGQQSCFKHRLWEQKAQVGLPILPLSHWVTVSEFLASEPPLSHLWMKGGIGLTKDRRWEVIRVTAHAKRTACDCPCSLIMLIDHCLLIDHSLSIGSFLSANTGAVKVPLKKNLGSYKSF